MVNERNNNIGSDKEEKKEIAMVNERNNNITFKLSDSSPPGYYFRPSDIGLINYLRRKILNLKHLLIDKFRDLNLYNYHPQQLSELYESGREKVWYFFVQSDKNTCRLRGSRLKIAKDGYWRGLTEIDVPIKPYFSYGYKMFFVFYERDGRDKFYTGVRTDWVMQEYRIDAPKMDGWTLCKMYKMTETLKRKRKREFTEEMFEDVTICDVDLLEVKPYHFLGDQAIDDMLEDPFFDYDDLEAHFSNQICSY